MLAYDGSHILHTAIAFLNVVLVEKSVIFVLSRKVFRYELLIYIYKIQLSMIMKSLSLIYANNSCNILTTSNNRFASSYLWLDKDDMARMVLESNSLNLNL